MCIIYTAKSLNIGYGRWDHVKVVGFLRYNYSNVIPLFTLKAQNYTH